MAITFKLKKQLIKDTHLLNQDSEFCILLHRNATIPWIIIVPKTDVIEVYDLSENMQKSLNTLSKHIADYFKKELSIDKMNIAAIGNIVSQLHIHVIGRKAGDACWPGVVWGNDYAFAKYTQEQIDNIACGAIIAFFITKNMMQ